MLRAILQDSLYRYVERSGLVRQKIGITEKGWFA